MLCYFCRKPEGLRPLREHAEVSPVKDRLVDVSTSAAGPSGANVFHEPPVATSSSELSLLPVISMSGCRVPSAEVNHSAVRGAASDEQGDVSSAYCDSNSDDDGVAKDADAPVTRQSKRRAQAAADGGPTRRYCTAVHCFTVSAILL